MQEISTTWLRGVRNSKNESINYVSKETGLTNSKISHLERGVTINPSIHDLLLLAKHYKINAVDFFKTCGFLTNQDLTEYKNCFSNSLKLRPEEIKLLQKMIDQLLINRGEKV